MKRAAIIITILAAIAFVVFIYIGNGSTASGSIQPQATLPASTTPIAESQSEQDNSSAITSSNEVIAEGKIVPNKFVNLSFNTSGLVEEVYISEGDTIEAGQLLAKLSGEEEFQASMAAAQLELVNAQQEIKRLYDEAPLAAAQALQEIATAPDAVTSAERTLNNLQSGVVSETDVEIARANVAFAENELNKAREAYQPFANKPEGNLQRAALLSRLAEKEQAYNDAVRQLNALTGAPTDQKISQAEADLALARAQLSEARKRFEILKNGPDPDDLTLAESRLNNADSQIAAAEAALNRLQLKAPFSGTVAKNDLKVGEYVAPGVSVLMLVDFSDWFLETTDLTELNVVKIKEGSPAVITCDALPDVQFPGSVVRINSIGENRQGDITYSVLVSMEDYDERLLWNMTCSVVIFSDN